MIITVIFVHHITHTLYYIVYRTTVKINTIQIKKMNRMMVMVLVMHVIIASLPIILIKRILIVMDVVMYVTAILIMIEFVSSEVVMLH